MPKTVHFYYSISSRYSYFASTQIEKLEHEAGCRVLWHPLYSVDLYTLRGTNPFEGESRSGQYDWSYRRYDAECWAGYYGVPYREPRRFDPGFLARSCVAADTLGAGVAYSRKMFDAIFVEDLPEVEEAECLARAKAVNLPKERFAQLVNSSETKRGLDRTAREAHRAGAFGVPTFVVGERTFWGNERLVLVRHFLKKPV